MLTRLTFATAISLTPVMASANAAPADVAALFEAMNMPEMIEIMRAEGLDYGEQIANDLFPDRISATWPDTVADIYNLEAMRAGFAAQFGEALGDTDIDVLIAFYESDVGQSVADLEVAARRALMDEDFEEASKEAAALAIAEEAPRVAMVEQFVDANDLVETNVVGAMNANFAFYLGLLDGGAFPQELTVDQILADVWSQEDDIRKNTYEWVYSYLLLAYQPLSDADLQTYIAFSESDEGQAMNTALFAAFDEMYEGISRALGLASSEYMSGQDL